jgi:hypothetical protein
MPQKPNDPREEPEENSAALPQSQPVPTREVVVTHFDSPPPSGKNQIHPRRPAPIVPTREERIEGRPEEDSGAVADDD